MYEEGVGLLHVIVEKSEMKLLPDMGEMCPE
jgi:hypothetical protein